MVSLLQEVIQGSLKYDLAKSYTTEQKKYLASHHKFVCYQLLADGGLISVSQSASGTGDKKKLVLFVDDAYYSFPGKEHMIQWADAFHRSRATAAAPVSTATTATSSTSSTSSSSTAASATAVVRKPSADSKPDDDARQFACPLCKNKVSIKSTAKRLALNMNRHQPLEEVQIQLDFDQIMRHPQKMTMCGDCARAPRASSWPSGLDAANVDVPSSRASSASGGEDGDENDEEEEEEEDESDDDDPNKTRDLTEADDPKTKSDRKPSEKSHVITTLGNQLMDELKAFVRMPFANYATESNGVPRTQTAEVMKSIKAITRSNEFKSDPFTYMEVHENDHVLEMRVLKAAREEFVKARADLETLINMPIKRYLTRENGVTKDTLKEVTAWIKSARQGNEYRSDPIGFTDSRRTDGTPGMRVMRAMLADYRKKKADASSSPVTATAAAADAKAVPETKAAPVVANSVTATAPMSSSRPVVSTSAKATSTTAAAAAAVQPPAKRQKTQRVSSPTSEWKVTDMSNNDSDADIISPRNAPIRPRFKQTPLPPSETTNDQLASSMLAAASSVSGAASATAAAWKDSSAAILRRKRPHHDTTTGPNGEDPYAVIPPSEYERGVEEGKKRERAYILESFFMCCVCTKVRTLALLSECGHSLCGACTEAWRQVDPRCPICKAMFPPVMYRDYEQQRLVNYVADIHNNYGRGTTSVFASNPAGEQETNYAMVANACDTWERCAKPNPVSRMLLENIDGVQEAIRLYRSHKPNLNCQLELVGKVLIVSPKGLTLDRLPLFNENSTNNVI